MGESGDEAQGHEVKMVGWGEWDLVTNKNHLPLVPPIAGRGRKVSSSCFGDSESQLAVIQRTAGRIQGPLRSRTQDCCQ